MAGLRTSPGWLATTFPPSTALTPVHHAHVVDVVNRQRALIRHTPEMETVAVLDDSVTYTWRALIPADVTQFFCWFKTDADTEIAITYNAVTYTVQLDGGPGDSRAQYATPLWTVAGPTPTVPTSIELTMLWTKGAITAAVLQPFVVVGFAI
jgi:hypothetical protein